MANFARHVVALTAASCAIAFTCTVHFCGNHAPRRPSSTSHDLNAITGNTYSFFCAETHDLVRSKGQVSQDRKEDMDAILLTVLGALLGTLTSAVITVTFEKLRKPRLVLSVLDPTDMQFDANQPAQNMRVLRVGLSNVPLWKGFSWMYRNPALQCHGEISFHRVDGTPLFPARMPLRWAGAPEPNP